MEIVVVEVVFAAVTCCVAATLGRFIARSSRAAAFLASALFAPVAIALYGWLSMVLSDVPPLHDGPAMAFFSGIFIAVVSLPACLVASALTLFGLSRVKSSTGRSQRT